MCHIMLLQWLHHLLTLKDIVTNEEGSLPYHTATYDTAPPTPRQLSCCLLPCTPVWAGWVICGAGTPSSLLCCWGFVHVSVRMQGDTITFWASGAGWGKPQHSKSSLVYWTLSFYVYTITIHVTRRAPHWQVTFQIPRLLPKSREIFAPISPIVTVLSVLSKVNWCLPRGL